MAIKFLGPQRLAAIIRHDENIRLSNRRLTRLLTDAVRKRYDDSGMVARLPWAENENPRIGEEWEKGKIILVQDEPRVIGWVNFRINDALEVGEMDIETDAERNRRLGK